MAPIDHLKPALPKPAQQALDKLEQAEKSAAKAIKQAVDAAKGQLAGKSPADTFENVKFIAREAVLNVVNEVVDRLTFALKGAPKGPFPSMSELSKHFPDAGVPLKMVGTNIDNAVMYDPKQDPDKVMAQCEALGFNSVRLGAYWDRIQPNGASQADFARLDQWLAAANKHHVRVILTVGSKAPNYPEFHAPIWAATDAKDASSDPAFRAKTLDFVKMVAEHEKNNPAICIWQVENEPFEHVGPNHAYLDPQMVAQEADILKAADGHKRPLMVNAFTQGDRQSVDKAFAVGDLVGIDPYKAVPVTQGSYERIVGGPEYALSLAQKTGKPVMVAELQADNWGDYKASAKDVTELTHSLEKMGYENFLFWRFDQNLQNEKAGDASLSQAEAALAKEALK